MYHALSMSFNFFNFPGSSSGANGSVPFANLFDPSGFATTNSGSKKADTEFVSIF
jgi:hypothetical protein